MCQSDAMKLLMHKKYLCGIDIMEHHILKLLTLQSHAKKIYHTSFNKTKLKLLSTEIPILKVLDLLSWIKSITEFILPSSNTCPR